MDDITRYKRNYHYDSYIHFLRRLNIDLIIESKRLNQVGECNNFGLNVFENEKLHQFWN